LPQQWQEAQFHFDHVVPRTAGGQTSDENIALACVGCSLKKGSRTECVDPVTLQTVKLFNPRIDLFYDHFRWTKDWRLQGKTPIGRATVAALDLNRLRLLEVRRDLALHGRFPPLLHK
jgi:hypothetical protein